VYLYFGDILPYLGMMLTALGVSFGMTVASFAIGGVFSVGVYLAKASSIRPLSMVASSYTGLFRNAPLLVDLPDLLRAARARHQPRRLHVQPDRSFAEQRGLLCGDHPRRIRLGAQGSGRSRRGTGAGYPDHLHQDLHRPRPTRGVPVAGNQFIHLFLTSSIASVIGLPELMHAILEINTQTYRAIEVLAIGAALYFVTGFVLSLLARFAERYLFRWAVSV
jgi:polar amino acid transport system permease protein